MGLIDQRRRSGSGPDEIYERLVFYQWIGTSFFQVDNRDAIDESIFREAVGDYNDLVIFLYKSLCDLRDVPPWL